jgi:hypothetical protein
MKRLKKKTAKGKYGAQSELLGVFLERGDHISPRDAQAATKLLAKKLPVYR